MRDVFASIGETAKFVTVLTVLSLIFLSCTQSPTSHVPRSRVWRYTSFTKMDMRTVSTPSGCVSIPDGTECSDFTSAMTPITMTGSGSGMIISHRGETTYILTAAHVCQSRRNYSMTISSLLGNAEILVDQRVMISSIDYFGNRHRAEVFASDNENDICVVVSPGAWGQPVPVASVEPEIGEQVYNVAAPLGIFEPRMVPIFDGRYAGQDSSDRRFYTIPTGPGSSGSAILNERGEIVGVIHSAFTQFENIAISSSLDDIRRLIRQIDQ